MIAYQGLRAESGRAGDKNTLQGLLYCPRCVWPFCVSFATSFNYCVLENNDTYELKFSFWAIQLVVGLFWNGSGVTDHHGKVETQYDEISTEPGHVFCFSKRYK